MSVAAPRIRDAEAGEGALLAALVAEQPLLVRYGVRAERLGADLEAARSRGDDLIVAEAAGHPCGFAWFQRAGTFAVGGYLRLIALRPGDEGRGLGAALLAALEARVATRSRTLFLLCSEDNHAARRFYARHGYAEAGRLPGFARPDLVELIIWKRLPGP